LDWYAGNQPAKGGWVDLASLENHPILVVAAAKDILVPPESAIAVAQQLPIQAKTQIWEPLRDWLVSTP